MYFVSGGYFLLSGTVVFVRSIKRARLGCVLNTDPLWHSQPTTNSRSDQAGFRGGEIKGNVCDRLCCDSPCAACLARGEKAPGKCGDNSSW